MTEIKGNLRYLQLPLMYPKNTIAELFFDCYSQLSMVPLEQFNATLDSCCTPRPRRNPWQLLRLEAVTQFVRVAARFRGGGVTWRRQRDMKVAV
jgi:hypothetical protein